MTLSNPGNPDDGLLNVGSGPQLKDAAGEALGSPVTSGEPGAGLFLTEGAGPCFLWGGPPLRPPEDDGVEGWKLSSGKDSVSHFPISGDEGWATPAKSGPCIIGVSNCIPTPEFIEGKPLDSFGVV